MNMDFHRLKEEILDNIESGKGKVLSAAIGFDACIDTITRPIRSVDLSETNEYFNTIHEFGTYLSSKAGLSCTINLRRISKRRGGNMPNLAAALTSLGTSVLCVGNMGKPKPDEVFLGIGERLISIGEAGTCDALQFDDGKIMLSNMESAQELSYKSLMREPESVLLVSAFANSDLAAFVNWAELSQATDIWRGIAEDAFMGNKPDKSKILLIDLTDCASRNKEQICLIKDVCAAISTHRKVVWSMNISESNQIANAIDCKGDNIEKTARNLVHALKADAIFIHDVTSCVVADKRGQNRVKGYPVTKPRITVGGGDTFNAGILFSQGLGMSICASALFANALVSCYVAQGELPSIESVLSLLQSE